MSQLNNDTNSNRNSLKFYKSTIFSSFLAPISSTAISLPIERLRSFRISYKDKFNEGFYSACKELELTKPSMIWRGYLAGAIRNMGDFVLLFSLRELISDNSPKYSHESDFKKYCWIQFQSGAISATMNLLITYPLRDKLVMKHIIVPKYWNVKRQALFEIPFYTLYFGIYHSLKVKSPFYSENNLGNIFGNTLAAFSSVYLTRVLTNPLKEIIIQLNISEFNNRKIITLREAFKNYQLSFPKNFRISLVNCIYQSLNLVMFDTFLQSLR